MTTEPGPRGRRWAVAALLAATGLLGGCAAATIATFAYEQANEGQCLSVGCAAVAVVRHAVDRATEGDPTPCRKLNTVERALSPRCGPYRPGTLHAADVAAPALPQCPLALAARDPGFWPMLPELLSKGASPESCAQPPLVALAQAHPCPDFSRASPAALQSLRWLAVADARSIHHDAVRLLSCPSARDAGLSGVLDAWLAQGDLPARGLPFGVLGALHPTHLDSPLARALEAAGHTAGAGLGAYAGELPAGFDAALRGAHRDALDWWLDRVPPLVNAVPPRQGNQLAWAPLARVITPGYLDDPAQQPELVAYLLSRGADPSRRLAHEPGQWVLALARRLHSPVLPLLERPPATNAAANALHGSGTLR